MSEWVLKMESAKTAKERKEIVEEYARILGSSKSFVYRKLKENGYESGRQNRKDLGVSNIDNDTLKLLAGVIKACIRENGKKTMPLQLARELLIKNGYDIPLKSSRLRELLKKAKLDAGRLEKDTHNIRLRSLYPNHVHECDPSVALIYFAPDSEKMKIIEDSEYYKNKDFFNPITDKSSGKVKRKKCLRYVLTDHYSGSICVRYYSGYGETAEYMYDFLLYAWKEKEKEGYAFHGVPEFLLWDKGSANTSKAVTNALKSLGVKTMTHAAGSSRVKGQVENANNLVETHFECFLRFEGVKTIEALNEAAERFCIQYNTKERIKRMGVTIASRYNLWMRIKENQLRELPGLNLCRQIFTNGVQVRKVKSDLTVNIYHPKAKATLIYNVSNIDVDAGDTVNAEAMIIGEELTALVWYIKNGEELSYELKPIELDSAGFDVNAVIIGKEYKTDKLTENEKEADKVSDISKELQKGKTLKSHSLIQPNTIFVKNKTGETIEIEKTHEILLSAVEAVKKVKSKIGYVPDNLTNKLKEDYPEGVPFSYVDEICTFYERNENIESKDNII